MVSKEILDEVYQFIKDHPNYNKRQVENGLKKYSRLTVRDAIDELISDDGKVAYRKDKPRGFYHLYINDKNEFNVLREAIDGIYEIAKRVNTRIDESLIGIMDGDKVNIYAQFPSLMRVGQLHLYTIISMLAQRISAINSVENRETLYLRLVKILAVSRKMNVSLVFDTLVKDIDALTSEFQEKKIEKKALMGANRSVKLLKDMVQDAKKLDEMIKPILDTA